MCYVIVGSSAMEGVFRGGVEVGVVLDVFVWAEKREGTGKILNKGGNKYIQPEKEGTYTIFQTTEK